MKCADFFEGLPVSLHGMRSGSDEQCDSLDLESGFTNLSTPTYWTYARKATQRGPDFRQTIVKGEIARQRPALREHNTQGFYHGNYRRSPLW